MMIRKKTIRFKIFTFYTIVIVVMSFAIAMILCSFMFSTLRDNTYSSLETIIDSQMNSIDEEVEKMDSLALNILYSYVTRETFIDTPQGEKEEAEWADDVSDMMATFATPAFPVPQIMLYDLNGHAIGTSSNRILQVDITEIPWYREIMSKDCYKLVSKPYSGKEKLLNINRFTSLELISLFRVVYDKYGYKKGIVEVKQYYARIFQKLEDFMERDIYVKAVVFNEDGEQIYPLKLSEDFSEYNLSNIVEHGEKEHVTIEYKNGQKKVLGYKKSDLTDWTMCMIWDNDKVMYSVYFYMAFLGIVVFGVMLVALTSAYYISKQISQPIEALRKRIGQLDVYNNLPKEKMQSDLTEIEEVNQTLDWASQNLAKTVNEMLLSQQQELHAKMLALQSQMNPHFLYNSLAVICALAEEDKSEQVIYTCRNISQMLRYIASGQSNIVPVKDEIQYTIQYLECMKIRYGDSLTYSIEIPEELMGKKLPKLTIQPLVENSIKSCTRCEGPWQVKVIGAMENGAWKISVQDNGEGFSEESINAFYGKIKKIDENRNLPGLELGGMGLVNVYMRLRLQYKECMIFKIGNEAQGRAEVTIGGI